MERTKQPAERRTLHLHGALIKAAPPLLIAATSLVAVWSWWFGAPWWPTALAVAAMTAVLFSLIDCRLAHRRLARALVNATDGFVEFDREFRYVDVNPAAERIIGQDRGSLLGRRLSSAHRDHDLSALIGRCQQILDSGRPARFEEHFAPTGIWIEAQGYPTGRGLGLFFRDITERWRNEDALRREAERRRRVEERFETALSVNPLVVFNLDPDLRYTWVYNNQVAWRDLDIVDKTPADLFDEESGRQLANFFHTVLESGTSRRIELALRPKALSQEFHFISSAKPVLSDSGEVIGLTGASFDITEMVRQKKELAQARQEAMAAKAEAERASLSRSKFLAAASHDLRQPVQSLLLLVGVLKERLAGTPVAKVADHMEDAVDALCVLLDSMLDISKLDAGVISPYLESVPLGRLLDRLAGEYALRAAEQGLEFRFVPTSAYSHTDPLLLERVLRNLIENALRYCPTGRVLVGCRHMGRIIRIDVLDTGIGIAAPQLEPIFDEFHQVGNTARDRKQGLGLGLAIVRRIMRLLGGRVEVVSTVGVGSRFSVTLPLAAADEGAQPAPFVGGEGQGQLVLVIEDDTILRGSLRIMLEDWGFRPRIAASGEEAVAMVEAGLRPDAIVTDYRLSDGINGIETVARVRQVVGTALPSLLITGDTAPERVREVLGSGLRILHKPVAAAELRHDLCDMLKSTLPAET